MSSLAERTAEVHWEGGLADGSGSVAGGGGALRGVGLDWASRSERADGTTSPEELLAAAHAACFAMTLALWLDKQGTTPQRIDVRAKCSLDRAGEEDWYRVSGLDLDVQVAADGLTEDALDAAIREADGKCALSHLLREPAPLRISASLAD